LAGLNSQRIPYTVNVIKKKQIVIPTSLALLGKIRTLAKIVNPMKNKLFRKILLKK